MLNASSYLGADKVFFAFPTLPTDPTALGAQQLAALHQERQVPRRHLAAQISALAAAEILTEALEHVGGDVTRQTLVDTLERLRDFATGVTPAVTYGPNRRVGVLGAYIVTVEPQTKSFRPLEWISLE